MRYGSICSGIEAASVAWHPMGWDAAWFAEIDPFPSAVLAHRFPGVPNLGDFTKIGDDHGRIDLIVGGTPCQDFSVAGRRAGFAGQRGSLTFAFVDLVRRIKPRWVVWENVLGILGGDTRRGFADFLGALSECGYPCAWRVLDAEYVRVDWLERAVPQRRRRVFVVGYLGDWRPPAAVLFEPESLRGDTPPRREAGERAAPTISARTKGGGGLGTDFDCDGGLVCSPVASTLNAHYGSKWGLENQHIDQGCPLYVAHSPRADGFDASEDGTGRGTPIVPVAFAHQQGGSNGLHVSRNVGLTIQANQGQAIAFDLAQITSAANRTNAAPGLPASTMSAASRMHVASRMAVRRLTPLECERLMGFPDHYTLVPYRGKPARDGPRYKALGNSMAVNCMRWIGRRIESVEAMI